MPRIHKQSCSEQFVQLQQCAAAQGEKNDCTVKALSVACDIDYATAHATMAALGRKERKGTYFMGGNLQNALATHGKKAVRVNLLELIATYPGAHSSLKNVTTHHPDRFAKVWPKGTFLLFTAGHVLCVKDGINHDWTRGTARRVLSMYKIESL